MEATAGVISLGVCSSEKNSSDTRAESVGILNDTRTSREHSLQNINKKTIFHASSEITSMNPPAHSCTQFLQWYTSAYSTRHPQTPVILDETMFSWENDGGGGSDGSSCSNNALGLTEKELTIISIIPFLLNGKLHRHTTAIPTATKDGVEKLKDRDLVNATKRKVEEKEFEDTSSTVPADGSLNTKTHEQASAHTADRKNGSRQATDQETKKNEESSSPPYCKRRKIEKRDLTKVPLQLKPTQPAVLTPAHKRSTAPKGGDESSCAKVVLEGPKCPLVVLKVAKSLGDDKVRCTFTRAQI